MSFTQFLSTSCKTRAQYPSQDTDFDTVKIRDISQGSFTWPVVSRAHCSVPHPLLAPAITHMFSISIILTFHRCYIIVIKPYSITFGDGLCSRGIILWWLSQVVTRTDCSFSYNWLIFCGVDITQLFSHLPTEGHLGCLQLLSIVNKAAANTGRDFHVNLSCHFLGINTQEHNSWVTLLAG